MNRIILLFFLLFPLLASAQMGTIRGVVTDGDTGEGIIGATVIVQGSTTGTVTDFDGSFSFDVEPGSYVLEVTYVGYQTLTIEDLEVKAGEVSLFDNIQLQEEDMQLGEVVVTAQSIRTTEAALLTIKQNSPKMLDGISAAQMKITGDGTAVEAAKRVTGVTIEGGKYVYVRGLGDRYSKTTLNGMDVPGLDPDRNTIQMDIFPTNLIDNLVVSKNFTADLPADFTGGLLNIETKDLPEERIMSASFGIGYTPGMNLNPDYLTYDGGGTDFLGFDDGTRSAPNGTDAASYPITGPEAEEFIGSFNKELGAQRQTAPMDISASFSYGDQININNKSTLNPRLGYIFSASYKSSFNYYDNIVNGEYYRLSDPDQYDLQQLETQRGQAGENNVLVGLLGGIAYKDNKKKYRLTAMHLQNGQSSAYQFDIENINSILGSGYEGMSDNLEYSQRSITNVLLNGEYLLGSKNDWQVEWGISPTLSVADDPDVRKTAFTTSNNNLSFSAGDAGIPTRIWRYLSEWNVGGKIDATKQMKLFDEDAELKFGVSHTYKYRDYSIVQADMNFVNSNDQSWPTTDADLVLQPEYIESNNANFISGTAPSNAYESNSQTTGVYSSLELSPFQSLKAIVGLRAENFTLRYSGEDQSGQVYDNTEVISSLDLFPSLNLIYSLQDNIKLRSAYSRTVARPSFKEASYAQILDPVSNRVFNGGLLQQMDPSTGVITWDGNIRETYINNIDLRAEFYPSRGELISISVFGKAFQDVLELTRPTQDLSGRNFQPRNVGDGMLYGTEIEVRKHFGFISEPMQNLSISTNITLVQSIIDINPNELEGRRNFARAGEEVSDTRQMAGQSPYVFNFGLSYNDSQLGLNTGIFYNVKGPTLSIVGNGVFPDVFDQPFNSLNFSLMKKLGEEQNTTLEFKVANLLNDRIERQFNSYRPNDETEREIFNAFSPGVSFSFGVNHNF